MPVGELFLSAFLQVLFDRLASRELLNFARREGVDSKLKKWKKTLKMIEAVLHDAEEKQLTDGAVKMWLDDLRDLAYDVEDILDEFATDALGNKLVAEDQASTSKVRSFIPACFHTWSLSAINFNVSMGSKMKEITRRMDDLCKQRIDLGLEKIAGGSSTSERQRLPPTTCLPIEPAVYGRDGDKAKIINMMSTCESGDNNFVVIPIVGMGGAGIAKINFLAPDTYLLPNILKACTGLSPLETGKQNIGDAHKVFDRLSQPDVKTFSALLVAYAQQGFNHSGHYEEAVLLFQRTHFEGFTLEEDSVSSVLSTVGD
ncbi:putative disease resistance RPP13-like protein 1 [Pistacia vera]|uniref:putative disease resistance RPP13-like protein 1 n=1 Tax=Pistacia vera TaxID=55513 RepID=UPI0012638BCB|nr:putative disease resistance RPP13-like protein 1 [Pistacia vera]